MSVIWKTPINVYVIFPGQQIQSWIQLNVKPFHKLNQHGVLGCVVSQHTTAKTRQSDHIFQSSPVI
jgi:hypothetical protein